ncbi:MAG: hypothetical protein A3H96_15335 [Acidobacteria bacterium RIFCSPLOWO2_02_FULL_67_36]|nr:MAG: hypothetical protein A3H96_15335 [Acidobacteria bacterium RIFCSPLOWO2_02_FULL_67_36]OFW19386.1 MAG: hypothetical protein A3G21_15505 [Acidobacteria bacterium RIFCSPLOWO2_12_FULL_66_21]
MKRLFSIVAVAAVVMLPVYAAGQDKPAAKAKAAAPAAKMLRASGTVTAVAADSLTIKEKTGDVTFAVDAKTKVTGPGAGTKTAEAKAAGKTTVLTDFVKVGDMVTVNYHEMDGTKHAANVRLMAATKK